MNFETIWSDYQTKLKRFLHSKVADQADVDDLFQTIMIKIYESHHTIKTEDNIKAWLFSVANNAIIDYYRKKSRIPGIEAKDLWFEETNTHTESELAQCIESFIDVLPAQSSNLLKEIDLNGRSQKQYARDLGISYSTLKSRVQKARTQLRDLFLDCCQFSLDHQGNIINYEPKLGNCKKCDT